MKVQLSGTLRGVASGRTEFAVEAGTINQILARLSRDYPELRETIEEGVSVAVDGVVFRGDFSREVSDGSEVILLAPLVGG